MENPAIKTNNLRPLFISREAKVAYFFELNSANEPVYCELPLDEDTQEVKKIILRHSVELRDIVTSQKSLLNRYFGRINLDGKPVLVYSKWNQVQQSGFGIMTRLPLGNPRAPGTPSANAKPKDQQIAPDCTLKFYSLDRRSVIYQI